MEESNHVEIILRPETIINPIGKTDIIKAVKCYMSTHSRYSCAEKFTNPFLSQNILSFSTTNEDGHKSKVDKIDEKNVYYHAYKLYDIEAADEVLDNRDDSELPAASHLIVPSTALHGLWESLVFDDNIKKNLLRYVKTIIQYSDRQIDPNIICCNRVILLHGPPGTGKTSLCRALAQKLAIHMCDRYQQGSLLEINSHSLFSRWFSESGNLVRKMFAKIEELVADQDNFVCVLIDEVESLTCARASHNSGTEPSDAIRVVNALLTQIDKIKHYPNVIIMATSNVTGKLDEAFIDRADVKQYIGNPCKQAIYKILRSCILELMRGGIIHPSVSVPEAESGYEDPNYHSFSNQLKEISEKCHGLSGRSLRKLPLYAHANYLNTGSYTLETFLDALTKSADSMFNEMKMLSD